LKRKSLYDATKYITYVQMKTRLLSINLLNELTRPENSALMAEFTENRHAGNSLIYSPGHEKNQVFIVKKGRLRLYLAVEDKDFSLAILESGDIFVSHTRAHVQSIEEVTLLVMPTARFHSCMTSHPALSATIIRILGEMLSQSFSIIDSLVFKDIRQRLTDFFLYETENNGLPTPSGTVVRIALTNIQLAAIIGSSRQTVSTIVSAMLKDGVLEKMSRNVYLIPNVDLLKNYGHTRV